MSMKLPSVRLGRCVAFAAGLLLLGGVRTRPAA
jgi:hypothetical protein